MEDTMDDLAKHVKTTESKNQIFMEYASSRNGIDERTPAGRLFSPGHSIGMVSRADKKIRDSHSLSIFGNLAGIGTGFRTKVTEKAFVCLILIRDGQKESGLILLTYEE